MSKVMNKKTKKKISQSLMGHSVTIQTRKKISITKKQQHIIPRSAFKKGNIPWNLGKHHSQTALDKMSKAKKGKKLSLQHRINLGKAGKGRIVSEKTRKKISEAMKGKNAPNWQGGKTQATLLARKDRRYKEWRDAVFLRDKYTCVWCNQKGGKLVADHINAWSKRSDLRFVLCNGRTLCEKCHRKTPNYGGKACKKNLLISMVIPTYTINTKLEQMAILCAHSYRSQVDELIITEDGGFFSQQLFNLADIYARHKKNQGFSKNVNLGWKLAHGQFVFIVNSDTRLLRGNLIDLCIPGKVTSPIITTQNIPYLAGPFWCSPKTVTEERGYLREEMHTYCSDDCYDHCVRDIFQKVPSVEIFHHKAQTVTAAGVEGKEQQEKDQRMYDLLKKRGLAT